AGDPQNYDRSESRARRSGSRLYDLLQTLRNQYSSLHVTAHSMGNVVVSEALKHAATQYDGRLVDSYIAMQAAEAAQNYSPDTPDALVPIPETIQTLY